MYQACRYGLDGTLTDVRSGEQRSIRQEIPQLADRLAPFAHQLKATAALEAVVRQAQIAAQRGAADASTLSPTAVRFPGWCKNTVEIWASIRQRGGYTRRRP
ncbi:hypothetical protein MJ390_08585 [Klebsiella pneumoniae]|nr:hypothetical protein MJ390_08585 [Klebsiella pneumoniae]